MTNGNPSELDQKKKALDTALDIRKFEIELYWKRAAYYWTFIAAAFAAYFVLLRIDDKDISDLLMIVSCLGFTFSITWYLANRGSKFWVRNWEVHVDDLEDKIQGTLFKTVIDKSQFKFKNLLAEYPYSVTKINHALNLYVSVIWLFLIIHSLSILFQFQEPFRGFNVLIILVATFVVLIMIVKDAKSDLDNQSIRLITRKIDIKKES